MCSGQQQLHRRGELERPGEHAEQPAGHGDREQPAEQPDQAGLGQFALGQVAGVDQQHGQRHVLAEPEQHARASVRRPRSGTVPAGSAPSTAELRRPARPGRPATTGNPAAAVRARPAYWRLRPGTRPSAPRPAGRSARPRPSAHHSGYSASRPASGQAGSQTSRADGRQDFAWRPRSRRGVLAVVAARSISRASRSPACADRGRRGRRPSLATGAAAVRLRCLSRGPPGRVTPHGRPPELLVGGRRGPGPRHVAQDVTGGVEVAQVVEVRHVLVAAESVPPVGRLVGARCQPGQHHRAEQRGADPA